MPRRAVRGKRKLHNLFLKNLALRALYLDIICFLKHYKYSTTTQCHICCAALDDCPALLGGSRPCAHAPRTHWQNYSIKLLYYTDNV